MSYLGDWFTTLALLLIAVELTGSAWAFAGLLLAKTAPTALVVPIAARLIGRTDRRLIMSATLAGRGLCVVGVVVGYGMGSFAVVLGFVALSAALSGVFQPARTAAIGALVPPQHLPRAIGLSGASWSVMLAVGAALGGLVTHWVGLPMALAIDGLTFAGALALTLALPALPATAQRAMPLWTALKRHHDALPTVLLKATMGLASGALSLLPLLVVQVGGDATALGLGGFYAARGAGALVGARVMAGQKDANALSRWINLGFAAVVVGLVLMVITGEPWGAAAGFAITGFGCTVVWVGSGVQIQAKAKGPARAALFAVETGAMAAAVALVSLPSSLLVDGGLMTPRAVVGLGAVLVGGSALLGALSRSGGRSIRGTVPDTPGTHLRCLLAQIGTTLTTFLLAEQQRVPGARGALTALLHDTGVACKKVASVVRRGALAGALGQEGEQNVQGESQKALDVLANDVMIEALGRNEQVAALASEELPDVWQVPEGRPRGPYLVAFDPLDGSSNIDNNLGIGTIFSVFRAPEDGRTPTAADFLQPGTAQVAAGYCLYGPATVLTLTTGAGVHQFTLDPDIGEFLLTATHVRIAPDATEFAINMSRQRHWTAPVHRYVSECLQGVEGPRHTDFNMRWIASLVAEVHRILARGGVFTYPLDALLVQAGKAGRLRLLYELLPMAFIVEQAGGAASTGAQRLMHVTPDDLHARAPVFLGARHEVERIERYHREAAAT